MALCGMAMEAKTSKLIKVAVLFSLVCFLAMMMAYAIHVHSDNEDASHSKSCNICVAHSSTLQTGISVTLAVGLAVIGQVTLSYSSCWMPIDVCGTLQSRAPPSHS